MGIKEIFSMRIVMIGFPSVEYTIELTEALGELEDVLLMIPEPHATRFEDVIKRNVNICPFCYPRLRYPTNLMMVYKILKKISEFKPDIIHIQRGHPWFNFALPFLKRTCLIVTIHDVVALDWPTKRLPAFTFKPPIIYGNQFIVHGKKLKKLMVHTHKKSPDDIHVLRRGVNSIYTRYIEKPIKDNGRTILYFGRIWGYKGLQYLIKAEPLITREIPDAKIIIAGAAKDFNQYEKMMVNRENFIVHNGYIPNEMVAKLFQEASLVALPYINGSQSGVIPMAYAFKKPVVITDVGSLPENVDPGVTGYIVPPKDPEKLAEVIIDLIINEEKRKKMGENAFKKTQEELSWDNIAVKTIKVYKKALSIKNSR
jgi:glycosyltransferase involved in cell wall biosynthesis